MAGVEMQMKGLSCVEELSSLLLLKIIWLVTLCSEKLSRSILFPMLLLCDSYAMNLLNFMGCLVNISLD